jgi:S1-C subfamily serine protease
MKTVLCITALFACALSGYSQPTGNVLLRVYQIRFHNETATAFLLDYEDRQYFVTARHVMESVADGTDASVELVGPTLKEWKSYPVTVLLGKNKCVDVAILIPAEKKLSPAEAIPYPYTYAFGQEAYFLGFPYGLYTSFAGQGTGGVALIKHAYVSARVRCYAIYKDGDTDQEFILLDGFNNPGFSGGPIVAPDMFSPFTNIRVQKLIGVVGGFVQVSSANTGIITATPIEKAVELIKAYVDKQKKP